MFTQNEFHSGHSRGKGAFARKSIALASIIATLFAATSCGLALSAINAPGDALALRKATYKSDFYSAVNRDWLLGNKRPPKGFNYYNSFSAVDDASNKALLAILDSLDPETQTAGTPKQMIAALYRTYLDFDRRDREGIKPIRKYLEAYDRASTLEGLMRADLECFRETGISCILGFETSQNASGVPALIHYGPRPSDYDLYRGGKNTRAYLEYLTTMFTLAGHDTRDAKARAKKVFDFERGLKSFALSPDRAADPENTIWYPFYLFRTLYPNIDFRKHFEAMGYAVPEGVLIRDQRLMEEAAKRFTDGNREILALYAEKTLLGMCGQTLSTDFDDAIVKFRTKVFGYRDDTNAPDYGKKKALEAVKFALPEYLGEVYVNACVSPKTRDDVSGIVERVVAEYARDIAAAGWMDPRTKERALAKLSAMSRKIAYPDKWNGDYDGVALRTPGEGGSLFENATALRLRRAALLRTSLGKETDRKDWSLYFPVYTVNAFYEGNQNSIYIPAGILQPPFYDPAKSESWNLGGIGVIAAHEISHAFDTNGAKIDENGSLRNWWTKGDYDKYAARCGRIRAFYDGQRGPYGARNDGTLTLSENVADVMGLQCALSILRKTANPDYREFFTAFATAFREVTTPETAHYLAKTNMHSIGRVRANRGVANFQEFQDAFAVKPGDAMYVAPENRVSVW